jgi:aldose 1-epimerase
MSEVIQHHIGSKKDGQNVEIYTLQNSSGMRCKILTLGGIISEWSIISKENRRVDIVLGFSDLESYLADHPFFGAITGRVAGRITGGKFSLDGKDYQLEINDPPNHLHGGSNALDKRIWQVEYADSTTLKLSYFSQDGEQGYPGNVQFTTDYHLSEDGQLSVTHGATTDQATPINLTSHSYFNLKGQGEGDILDHQLQVRAQHYATTDSHGTLLEKASISPQEPGSFQNTKSIREALPYIAHRHGDLYFLENPSGKLLPVITLTEPISGRTLTVKTTDHCLQLYFGKFISEQLVGKNNRAYKPFSGLCLECHGYPNGVNRPELGDIILPPDEKYSQTTIYHLSN